MMDYNKLLSEKVRTVKPSGIRKYFDLAEHMEDVVSLGVGEPDFQTPWHIREAGIRSLELGKTRYTSNWGLLELRRSISAYLKDRQGILYDPENELLVTVGGSEAIDACMRTFIEPGDEVIIPEPSFVCYKPLAIMSGGTPIAVETRAEDNFRLTAKALKAAITDRTKLLILPYPNNPTGGVMRKEHLEEIAEVLRDTDIMVLSDEIYCELTYGDTPHCSIASLPGMRERTVVINGFSKSYSMTGWRIGFAAGPSPVIHMMTKLHQFAIMSAPTTAQYAAIEAMKKGDGDIAKMRSQYDMRRRFMVDGLRKMGLDCFEPEGAFYIFPSIKSTGLTSDEFCERLLLEKKIAVIPGTAFGDSGEGFIRISYCYSTAHLKLALSRIAEFLEDLKKER